MRALILAGLLMTTAAACGPRKVEVVSGTQTISEVSLSVTNNLKDEVSIYVIVGGQETFLKRVPANSNEQFMVPNVRSGTTVSLKATPVNGGDSYVRDNVTLSGTFEWTVP